MTGTSLFSFNTLCAILVLGLTYYIANLYWKRKALARASDWAAACELTLVSIAPAKFEMHRQTPRISFQAIDAAGRKFDCTLELRATSFLLGPLHSSASAQLLQKVDLLVNSASPDGQHGSPLGQSSSFTLNGSHREE
jgi:hypothetical protein